MARSARPAPAATAGTAPGLRRVATVVAGVAAAVVAIDQATKSWALEALADGPVHVVWTLDLDLTFNTGTAFSLGRGLGPVLALLAVAVLAVLLRSGVATASTGAAVAVGLVLGGALGNLTDRALRTTDGEGFLGGAVVDFVDLGWWPVFNVADAAIVVGAVGVVLAGWGAPDR